MIRSVQTIAGDSDPKHLYRVQSGPSHLHDHHDGGKATRRTFYVIASSPRACFEFIAQAEGEEGDSQSHVSVELVEGSVFDVDVEEQAAGILR